MCVRRLAAVVTVLGAALAALLAATATATAAASAAAPAEPKLDVSPRLLRAAVQCPAHFTHQSREAVLLVHGTGLNAQQSWSWNYSQTLPAAGFDVCTVTLPGQALGDIQVSAEYVVWALRHMHRLTRAPLAMISHSQGGMEARWALRWWPSLRRYVADLIDLASPNHGIVAANACAGSGNCWPAVWQMAGGSHFLAALDSGDETPGPTAYTQLYSLTDELVEPSSTAPLPGGTNTANVAVQSLCPGRPVHHAGMLSDPMVWQLVLDALTHPGPADPARVVDPTVCLEPFMPGLTAHEVIAGNALLYSRAAIAFDQHPGVRAEPPLKPYATGRPARRRHPARHRVRRRRLRPR